MDRRSYLLLRRAAIVGAVSAVLFLVGFIVYRRATDIPGTALGVGSLSIVAVVIAALAAGFVVYLRRLETNTGAWFADAPRFFGPRADDFGEGSSEFDEVVERLEDGSFPREQSVPADHLNSIKLSVDGKSSSTQIDMSEVPPRLVSSDPEWAEVLDGLRSRYPIVRQLLDKGHKPANQLMETSDLTRSEHRDRRNVDGTITRLNIRQVPALTGIIDNPRGLELVFEPLSGHDKRLWDRALGKMITHLAMNSLTIRQEGASMVVSFNDKISDLPMASPLSAPIKVDPSSDKYRSDLGRSAYGPAFINWANNSGMVVGGVPGSGKTASMLPVFAGFAGRAEIHIADGKLGFDLDPMRPICRTFDNDGGYSDGKLYALLMSMMFMVDTRSRAKAIMDAFGIANFWNVPVEKREAAGLYPVFVIIDECQFWFSPGKLDKEEKEACDAILASVRSLIQRGRSLGIMVVLTTQKPDATTIPTVIRDNAGLKIAFRVSTFEQGKTILGALGPEAQSPVDIPQDARGRCVMDVEGNGSNLIQTNYVPPDVIATWLTAYKPVPDQFERACGYPLAVAMQHYHEGNLPPAPVGSSGDGNQSNLAVVDEGSDVNYVDPRQRDSVIVSAQAEGLGDYDDDDVDEGDGKHLF